MNTNTEHIQRLQLSNILLDEIKILCAHDIGNNFLEILQSMENRIPTLIDRLMELDENSLQSMCQHTDREITDNFSCNDFMFNRSSSFGYIIHYTQDWILFHNILQEVNFIEGFHLKKEFKMIDYNIPNALQTMNSSKTSMITEDNIDRKKILAQEFRNNVNNYKHMRKQRQNIKNEMDKKWIKLSSVNESCSYLRNIVTTQLMYHIREGNVTILNEFKHICEKVIFMRELDNKCLSRTIPSEILNGTLPPRQYNNSLQLKLIHDVFINMLKEFINFITRFGYRLSGLN